VVGRIDDHLDVLVLLSPTAAGPLGLAQGEVVHVRVTIRKVATSDAPILAEDTSPSADPDRIPAPVAPPTGEAQPTTEVAQAVKTGTPAGTSEGTEPTKGSVPAESVTPAVEEPVVEELVEEPVVEEVAVEEPATEEVVVEEPVEEPVVEEVVVEEPVEEPVVEEPVVEEVAVEEPATEEDSLLAELAGRAPQKQLFLPPREDEMFVYQEPVEPPAVEVVGVEPEVEPITEVEPEAIEVPVVTEVVAEPAVETLVVATLAEPEIASDPGPAEPESSAEPITLVEASPPAEVRPELVETLVATAPEPVPEAATALLEPGIAPTAVAVTDGQAAIATVAETTETTTETVTVTVTEPPAETPAVVAAATTTAVTTARPAGTKTVAVVLDLPAHGSLTYYLQLAAYSTEAMARDTAARLSSTYPVLVLAPPAGSKPLYRVFVGPLNKAESGTLLNQFRHLGFPDAFARTAQN
jgi:hypothetical protein